MAHCLQSFIKSHSHGEGEGAEDFMCSACNFSQNMHLHLQKNFICMECKTTDELWVCLECAHVGCGRLQRGHALAHYSGTNHIWAMNIETLEIWDYKQSIYLQHNLIDEKIKISFQSCATSTLLLASTNQSQSQCQCPVCCHTQIPKLTEVSQCMSCGMTENLWLCLSCNYIGCGRYSLGHAFKHYGLTDHPYVMDMYNFSIWNYKEEKYLHRRMTAVAETPVIVKSEVIAECMEGLEERMERLETEWKNFCQLKETNSQMISIEQRLLALCEEKQQLEGQLWEHDNKLNDLLNQFKDINRNTICSSKTSHLTSIESRSHQNGMETIQNSLTLSTCDEIATTTMSPSSTTNDDENQSKAILFLISILFLYHFLHLFGEIFKLN